MLALTAVLWIPQRRRSKHMCPFFVSNLFLWTHCLQESHAENIPRFPSFLRQNNCPLNEDIMLVSSLVTASTFGYNAAMNRRGPMTVHVPNFIFMKGWVNSQEWNCRKIFMLTLPLQTDPSLLCTGLDIVKLILLSSNNIKYFNWTVKRISF